MLDVRRMQVLRAVVTSGSVTAAAANLGYTPSAVSQQVAALEKQAGAPLLERVGRGVRPTAAGRLLSEHASLVGTCLADAETALADLRAGRTGRLAVRYFATAGATLVAPAVARFRAARPHIEIDLAAVDPADPLQEVAEGRADLTVIADHRHQPGPQRGPVRDGARGTAVRLVDLLSDPYCAVLPVGHRLAGEGPLSLAELADEPWVGSELPGEPCRRIVLDACAAAGFSPRFVVEGGDYATAQGFVAAGLGVSLVPRVGLTTRHPDVAVRELCRPQPVRAICAAVRATRTGEVAAGHPALRDLLDAFREAAGAVSRATPHVPPDEGR